MTNFESFLGKRVKVTGILMDGRLVTFAGNLETINFPYAVVGRLPLREVQKMEEFPEVILKSPVKKSK